MTPDELHSRYRSEIEKRASDDKYIDGIEERELMQIAIQHGFAPERARAFLAEVCREKGYLIEAAIVQAIREKLQSSSTGGRLGRASFERVVRETHSLVSGTTRTELDVRKLIVTTLDDAGIVCGKTWGIFDWYSRMKGRIGLR